MVATAFLQNSCMVKLCGKSLIDLTWALHPVMTPPVQSQQQSMCCAMYAGPQQQVCTERQGAFCQCVNATLQLCYLQVRLEQELHINQLELHRLKLTASANRLTELSPSAELALQTQLAEAESSLEAKQHEMADVTSQLQDHREVLASLQQVRCSNNIPHTVTWVFRALVLDKPLTDSRSHRQGPPRL